MAMCTTTTPSSVRAPCRSITLATGSTKPGPFSRRDARLLGKGWMVEARSRLSPRATATLGLLSASITMARNPRRAASRASVADRVVLPAPPLPATATRRGVIFRRPKRSADRSRCSARDRRTDSGGSPGGLRPRRAATRRPACSGPGGGCGVRGLAPAAGGASEGGPHWLESRKRRRLEVQPHPVRSSFAERAQLDRSRGIHRERIHLRVVYL